MKNTNIEELIIDYIDNNITENIKEEFLNAAIHFVVNEELCSREDITRIKYRFKKIKSNDVMNYVKIGVTYGYILYRAVLFDLVAEELKSKCCEVLIKISSEITKFVTMESDEEELFMSVRIIISNLYISDKCNNKVLSKFDGCKILY